MTEENVPGSEYVNVSANNISSWCTSSRGTIFTWAADSEQCKISVIPSRNSETNSFQNRRADFETKVNFSKKESIEAMPPHTKSVQENNNNGPEERELKQRTANLCWMRSSLLASVDITEFQTTDAYSSLDLTNVIYNLSKHSRDEKFKVILRTRPSSLKQCEKI
jgi:hypothetical protein